MQLPQNRIQSVESVEDAPVMLDGHTEPRLIDIAGLELGTMPGLIERFNGQDVVSLTANIHGLMLGEAAQKLSGAISAAGTPPKGVRVVLRGELPALQQTLSGLGTGLVLAVLVIFSSVGGELSILRLALSIVLTVSPPCHGRNQGRLTSPPISPTSALAPSRRQDRSEKGRSCRPRFQARVLSC